MELSIIILSGGLDSAVSAYLALQHSIPRLALFFGYGQRAVRQERIAAMEIAGHLKVPLKILNLPWLAELGTSSLTHAAKSLPRIHSDQLDDPAVTTNSARHVWVPNRNGVFLNIAAAYAESLGAGLVVTGFNAEEAATFPDNSQAFINASEKFFHYATLNQVKVISYTQKWGKIKIVQKGIELEVPFEILWSCYENGVKQCGRCESCLRSMRAYKGAGIWERMEARYEV